MIDFLKRHPNLLNTAIRFGWVSRLFTRLFIGSFAESAPPRPRPFSLASDFTSWRSLTDKKFTGRHLPADDIPDLPPADEIAELWRRHPSREIPSNRSSLLFAFFAQWLTDSFLRTDLRDTRRNHSNHELDLCQIYGLGPTQSRCLRAGWGGRLKAQLLDEIDGLEFPPYLFDQVRINADWDGFVANPRSFVLEQFRDLHDNDRLDSVVFNTDPDQLRYYFATGLEHGNSSVGQLLMNTIWLREHNRIAAKLSRTYDFKDDDEIFERARNINILQYLRIIIRDYIRHISTIDIPLEIVPGMAEKKNWYRENWITIEFNLLYRWHSMVPDEFIVEGNSYDASTFSRNTTLLRKHGIEALVTAASIQRAGRIGLENTHTLFFNEFQTDSGPRDSVMLRSVKMGREAKVGRFNDYRKAFGLRPLDRFEELTKSEKVRRWLSRLYPGGINDLEWHVGVFAEDPPEGGLFGDLMTRMVGYDAFTHALTNPLLSKQVYGESTFTGWGLEYAEATDTLNQVVRRNVADPASVVASFGVERPVPGSYGLPIVGLVVDTIDFLFVSGWRRFFEQRRRQLNSTVFKANNLMRSIVVLDKLGMEPFINWDGRLEKIDGFGPVGPPPELVGNVRPSVFQDGHTHEQHKALYIKMLEERAAQLGPCLSSVFWDHAKRWETREPKPMRRNIEEFAADFVYRWYLDDSPDLAKVCDLYLGIFNHRPIIRSLPFSGFARAQAHYREIVDFIETAEAFDVYYQLAKTVGPFDRQQLVHQLAFVWGVNNFLGLQNFAKSIWAELANNPRVRSALAEELSASAEAYTPGLDSYLLEVLRKHPPVFFVFGRATRDFSLRASTGVYSIKKGSHMTAAIPMAQLDLETFPDPDAFDPERFIKGDRPSNLVWPHTTHTAPIRLTGHGCPGRDSAFQFGRQFCRHLLLDCAWEMKRQSWSDRRFSLNVAAPVGDLEVKFFQITS